MNVMLKVMERVSSLKSIGCKFQSKKEDDNLLGDAAFCIGVLQDRFPRDCDDDKCSLSVDHRRKITNAYMSAINNKSAIAGLENLMATIEVILEEVKEK